MDMAQATNREHCRKEEEVFTTQDVQLVSLKPCTWPAKKGTEKEEICQKIEKDPGT